jgi:excisionase family DNA binding protein
MGSRSQSIPHRILLRLPEAAAALGLGRSTIYGLIARGELSVIRVGRSVRISVAELNAWAEREAERQRSTSQADSGV